MQWWPEINNVFSTILVNSQLTLNLGPNPSTQNSDDNCILPNGQRCPTQFQSISILGLININYPSSSSFCTKLCASNCNNVSCCTSVCDDPKLQVNDKDACYATCAKAFPCCPVNTTGILLHTPPNSVKELYMPIQPDFSCPDCTSPSNTRKACSSEFIQLI